MHHLALRAGGRGEKTKSLLQEAAASLALAVPGTDKDSEETRALMRAALTALEDSARVMEAGDQLLSIDGKVKVRIKVAEILNRDGTVLGTYQDRTCIILFPSPRFVMPGDEYLCIDSGTGELKGLPSGGSLQPLPPTLRRRGLSRESPPHQATSTRAPSSPATR